MIKVQGSSHRKDFVYCVNCGVEFVWLKAEERLKEGNLGDFIKSKQSKDGGKSK